MTLSRRRQIFIDEYLKCWNSSEAARRAGYKGRPNVAGPRLMAKDSILAEITKRLEESHMSADEALKLLADQARGDIAELMDITSFGGNLDMQQAKERGLTKLIKKYRQTTTTKIGRKQDDDDEERTVLEVELYDAQAALDKILRVHGKYKDNGISNLPPGSEVIIHVGIDPEKI